MKTFYSVSLVVLLILGVHLKQEYNQATNNWPVDCPHYHYLAWHSDAVYSYDCERSFEDLDGYDHWYDLHRRIAEYQREACYAKLQP